MAEKDMTLPWESEEAPANRAEGAFVIDVGGFEGPLDLLLQLARNQKVDLTKISILALAEQYLDYIAQLGQMRLEIAADYLVMAAWLAYLKSRLLLPEPQADDEPSGEEMAAALALRLQRLELIRKYAVQLGDRARLDRDVFGRGAPEPIEVERKSTYTATLYDLLSAYATQRRRNTVVVHHVRKREVWALAEARAALSRLIGRIAEWTPLEVFLSPYIANPEQRRTVLASAFAAGLELVREGGLSMRQSAPFAPIHLRDGAKARPGGLEQSGVANG
jgi:segregation and condensation protein A